MYLIEVLDYANFFMIVDIFILELPWVLSLI